MIESADEFKEWFDAPASLERARKLREQASPSALSEVVRRFPQCRGEVARRRDVPLDLLAELRNDEDERLRWYVRTNERWLEQHPDDAEPWRDDPSVPIQFRLTDDERDLLRQGLLEWGGPANGTDELAVAMGFRDLGDLLEEGHRLGEGIAAGEPQSRTDWTRALVATEFAFASNVLGSGWDWSITTGFPDETTLALLRGLQRKLVTGGVVGTVFGTRPPHGSP